MKRQSVVWYIALCSLLCVAGITTAQQPTPAPAAPAPAAVPTTPTAEAPAVSPTSATPASAADEVPTYDFKEADLNATLTSLARRSGLSVIVGDGVTGKVTVHLENVSPRDAMRLIIESKGFIMQEEKNIVKVRTKEAAEIQPLEVRVYTLKYAKAEDVKKLIDDIKTPRGKIQADLRSNMLIISDTSVQLEKLMTVLEQLDTQTPQVMIEAKFIETTKNPKKDLGINWSGTALNHSITAGGPPLGSGGSGAGAKPTGPFVAGLPKWNSPAVLDFGQATLVFSYLNQDSDSELLASPRVVTADNGKAKINITQQYPLPSFTFNQQTAGLEINGFNYKDIGIILNVIPHINKDNFVTLEIAPEVSSSSASVPFASGNGTSFNIPIIDTRQAATTVLIKSGNTLAMGGLIREDVADNFTKVPVMGDIPGLGAFFRSKSLSRVKRNLLIFLTPTVVKSDASNPTGLEKYSNGLPFEDIFTNDKWMPKDNAKPRKFITLPEPKPSRPTPDKLTPGKAPTQNFVPATTNEP